MPKPAPPPSQVEGRHQQLTERYTRLFNKKKTLEGQAARNAEAELQTVIDEARGLESQYGFPETLRLQEYIGIERRPHTIRLEPLIIKAGPEEPEEPEPEELPREQRLISDSGFGRTNASRYKKMYKS